MAGAPSGFGIPKASILPIDSCRNAPVVPVQTVDADRIIDTGRLQGELDHPVGVAPRRPPGLMRFSLEGP